MAQTMYTQVSKCKNDKIKGEKERKKEKKKKKKKKKKKRDNRVRS
jgi:hypothetical protein